MGHFRGKLASLMMLSIASLAIRQGGDFGVAASITGPVLRTRAESPSHPFQWEQITPTPHLVYHPCFGDYQCARLELPMDWNAERSGSKIALAVIKLPAKVPVTDARYGGPVVVNPGGPSGSGVSQVLTDAKRMQGIVDTEDPADKPGNHSAASERYFDILSFDPRGVNNTTPAFTCFQDCATRDSFKLQQASEGMLGSSDYAFDTAWARAASLGTTCSQLAEDSRLKGEEWIGHHMNTPPVVADMVELIERHGEWREKEAEKLLHSKSGQQKPDGDAIRQQTRWHKGEEKLLYWGISYGSLLGMTFAAMHPDRVQRVLVDGVLDAPDYYAGGWLKNIQDADHALNTFFEGCHEAGPTGCALADGGSPEDIKSRVDELIEDLKTNPVAVPGSATRPPDIITYTDVKTAIKNAIYQPMVQFGMVAQFLADLSRNNGSSFADFKYQSAAGTCPDPDQPGVSEDNMFDAQPSIICTDGESIDGITKAKYRQYWQTLRGQSKTIGDDWSQVRLSCIKWKPRPAWQFDGPIAGKTSHPLLLIGNTYDPVTPFRNAVKMSRGFPKSVVLRQNSVGHCTLSGPSECTSRAIRRYFQTGDLPRSGTVCELDERPFGLPAVKSG